MRFQGPQKKEDSSNLQQKKQNKNKTNEHKHEGAH